MAQALLRQPSRWSLPGLSTITRANAAYSPVHAAAAGAVQTAAKVRAFSSSTSLNYPTTGALKAALDSNIRWASDTATKNPEFFPRCAKGQTPKILWLGCSDSRVPETTVLGLQPGEVFVHRNIANIMNPTDLSMLSVVEFSVRYLKVEQIVVCGHSSCGGVAATLANNSLGVLDVWLQPMRALRERHAEALAKLSEADRATTLGKVNVFAGVEVIKRIPTVVEAMKERGLTVHGAIFHLDSGKVEELSYTEEDSAESTRFDAFTLNKQ